MSKKFSFIKLDRDLYLACRFAKTIQDNGADGGFANWKADKYYGYTARQVALARNYLKSQYKFNKTTGIKNYAKKEKIQESHLICNHYCKINGKVYKPHTPVIVPKEIEDRLFTGLGFTKVITSMRLVQ